VIDQVSMMVQAGLGIDAALARAANPATDRSPKNWHASDKTSASASSEVWRWRTWPSERRRRIAHGGRCARPGRTVRQPVSQTLEIQAQELRLKRRQYAEEQAMKLPVKLLFPMAFCILPVLLVVILAPAVMSISESLG
jgi:tight adherence protein C